MLADSVEQSLSDGLRVGVRVGAGSQADGPEAAAAGRGDRAGCGVEGTVVAGLDAVAEEDEDVGFVDRGGGEDAGSGRGASDFGDGEPLRAGEGGGGVEAEASAADALPMLAGRVAAAGEAVGEGKGE